VVEPTTRCVDTESLSTFAPHRLYRKDRHQAFPTIHAYEMGVLDTTLYDKVCQLIVTGQWFSRVLRFPSPIKLRATI
jgi:hypothetical protein